jgi:hypothetical protein
MAQGGKSMYGASPRGAAMVRLPRPRSAKERRVELVTHEAGLPQRPSPQQIGS